MKNKTLVLDYSIWRCGNNGAHKVGKGPTALHNDDGFECCLGQFCRQLNPEIKTEQMHENGTPESLDIKIPFLVTRYGHNSKLSKDAVLINDDPGTTPGQKISFLRKLFGKKRFKIKVINKNKKLT